MYHTQVLLGSSNHLTFLHKHRLSQVRKVSESYCFSIEVFGKAKVLYDHIVNVMNLITASSTLANPSVSYMSKGGSSRVSLQIGTPLSPVSNDASGQSSSMSNFSKLHDSTIVLVSAKALLTYSYGHFSLHVFIDDGYKLSDMISQVTNINKKAQKTRIQRKRKRFQLPVAHLDFDSLLQDVGQRKKPSFGGDVFLI